MSPNFGAASRYRTTKFQRMLKKEILAQSDGNGNLGTQQLDTRLEKIQLMANMFLSGIVE